MSVKVVRPEALLIGIFILALFIRLLYVTQIISTPIFYGLATDAEKYDTFALHILKGSFIYKESLYLNPLYPFFLTFIYLLFGYSHLSVILIQGIFDSLNCILIYYIASTLFNKRVGIIAAFIYACYGIAIFYTGIFLSTTAEIFLTLLFVTSLLIAQERMRLPLFLIAGILFGLVVAARPNVMVFLIFLPLWLFNVLKDTLRVEKVIKVSLLFLVGFFLVLSPIIIRNYLIEKRLFYSIQGGLSFYIGNNPKATGTFMTPYGISYSPIEQVKNSIDYAEKELGKELTAPQASRYWFVKGLKYVKSHPLDALLLYGKKCALFWRNEEIGLNINYTLSKSLAPIFQLPFFTFGIIAPFAIIGIVLSITKGGNILLINLFTFSYMISVIIFFISERYRLPVVPFLIMYCSYSLCWLAKITVAKKVREILLGSTFLILLFLAINQPFAYFKQGPSSPDYNNLGVAYNNMKHWDEAIAAFEKSLSLDPQNVHAYYNLGNVYYKKGSHEEAIDKYAKALTLDPEFADAHHNLGLVYDTLGTVDKAAQEYQRVLSIDPSHLNAHINLGNLYRAQGLYQEAGNHYLKALEIEPNSAEVLNNLGLVYGKQGRLNQAISTFSSALAVKPDHEEAYYNRGTAYGRLGRIDEAIADLKKALAINPNRAEVHHNLGIFYYKKGMHKEALTEFKQAVILNPDLAESYKKLGMNTRTPRQEKVPREENVH